MRLVKEAKEKGTVYVTHFMAGNYLDDYIKLQECRLQKDLNITRLMPRYKKTTPPEERIYIPKEYKRWVQQYPTYKVFYLDSLTASYIADFMIVDQEKLLLTLHIGPEMPPARPQALLFENNPKFVASKLAEFERMTLPRKDPKGEAPQSDKRTSRSR